MNVPARPAGIHAEVGQTLQALRRSGFQRLRFPMALESRFEADTRSARAHRLWLEGLIAILVFNACLMLDYLLVQNIAWQVLVSRIAIITPLSLCVNLLMRFNPPRWLREGSIALAMLAICFINLDVQGTSTPAHVLFGAICALITSLFAGVVMRLRFRYAALSIGIMLLASVWQISQADGLDLSEVIVSTSLMIMAAGIILIAAFSLEREERLSYLLCLQGDLQSEALANANSELRRLSTLDKLTSLPNRRAFEDRFAELWAECFEAAQPLAAIVIDIDHFKNINDVYGHIYGDEALRRIAGLLPLALRGPDDMAARYGGEEFVLLLPQADDTIALRVAERVRTLVETTGTPLTSHTTGEATFWATVSCGVSHCIPTASLTTTQLLEAADRALYTAKRAGRNCVKFNDCISTSSKPAHALAPEPLRPKPQPIHPRHSESGIRAALSASP